MRFAFLLLTLVVGMACAEGGGRRADAPRADFGTPTSDAQPPDGSPAFPDLSPGTDLGPSGQDMAPPRMCSSIADCDDGVACNGMELCDGAGVCQAGMPVTCDDGVACTRDSCSEPGGTCTHTPDNSLCGAGQTCTATGCSGGSSCSETPCKLTSPQCGCASGEACYMDPDGMRGCAPAGTSGTGAACSVIADCAGGNTCIGLSDTVAACHRFCTTDADCTRPGALCILGLQDTMMNPISGIETCTLGCEPATNTGCPSGSWCFLGEETAAPMRDLSHCSADPPGTGRQGTPCAGQADCAPGFLCLDPGSGSSECLKMCRNPSTSFPTTNADCGSFFEDCYALDPTVALGSTTYGVCF